ncbi:hypothetical protein BCR42DRAFT_410626, partial [Absidia repens]
THDDGGDGDTHKSKVTFDLPEITAEPAELESDTPPSPRIDINAHIVPDVIQVALLGRKQEMKELVQHNISLFRMIQQYLGQTRWSVFEKILYCTRQQLSDEEWMTRIAFFLRRNSPLLLTFKELVGYVGKEKEEEPCSFLSHVNICQIRRYPDRLQSLRSDYPQFFINCQQALQENEMSQLESLLLEPPSELPDNSWKNAINRLFAHHSDLMDQLKEIVAYEVDDE